MLLIILCAVGVFSAKAQVKGNAAVGGNLTIGMGDEYTNTALGTKFQYNVSNPIRMEGSFTYFFKKDFFSMWDLSINGHYLIDLPNPKFFAYPIVGLSLMGAKFNAPFGGISWGYDEDYYDDGSDSSTNFGFNLGGGIEYTLTDRININAEVKYRISLEESFLADRFLISFGAIYKF